MAVNGEGTVHIQSFELQGIWFPSPSLFPTSLQSFLSSVFASHFLSVITNICYLLNRYTYHYVSVFNLRFPFFLLTFPNNFSWQKPEAAADFSASVATFSKLDNHYSRANLIFLSFGALSLCYSLAFLEKHFRTLARTTTTLPPVFL